MDPVHLSLRARWHSQYVIRRLAACLALVCAISAKAEPSRPTGHPDSQHLLALVEAEIESGLRRRGHEAIAKREAYRSHIAGLMNASSGDRTYSDKTGNCRLTWVDRMMRRPEAATAEADQFTRQLHKAVRNETDGLHHLLRVAAARMDLDFTHAESAVYPKGKQPEAVLGYVAGRIASARTAFDRAMIPLDAEARALLASQLYAVSTRDIASGASFSNRDLGRQVIDQVERIDHAQLYVAADALLGLAAPTLLADLAAMPDAMSSPIAINGVTGELQYRFLFGEVTILVGGRGDNTYALDTLAHVDAVIDLGGNDIYVEGQCSFDRPVLLVIDLDGNDVYRGMNPGIQGGAILGVSTLIDIAGDDQYDAEDISQGSALAGVGILLDHAGDDRYRGLRRTQGQAIGGIGLLIDRAGQDTYHAALLAQGVGGPVGFGMLDDLQGNDHYYAGGKYNNPYGTTPGYDGWSQGVGAGPRGVANGGLGVLLDGEGDDVYECDYFSHGGGYWFAAGFARDFSGNDLRIGATRVAYDGGPRKDEQFLRWGFAYGCHFASGFLFDDDGDDIYGGNIVGIAFAWDFGVTALCDFSGNDRYEIPSSGSALSAEAGLAILLDASGNDHYASSEHGRARPGGVPRGIRWPRTMGPRPGSIWVYIVPSDGGATVGVVPAA